MQETDMRIIGRRAGRAGIEIPVLGLGGAPLGDLYARLPEAEALGTIRTAYDAGIRLFDTAPYYGHGLSEHRFGHVLRQMPRESYVLSTKVGRWLEPRPIEKVERGIWAGSLAMQPVLDYSYDGTMRAIEQSLQRLGIDRIDILLIHDVDVWTHGSAEAYEQRYREAVAGAAKALVELRAQGVVRAIGAGINEIGSAERFLREVDLDCLMLAGRYTLLEQGAIERLLPLAEARGIRLLIAGPFNSGILAVGAREGAQYDYKPAASEIRARVARLEAICVRHQVPLAAAALQFPLGHPAVAAVVPGAVRAEEVRRNLALFRQPIPPALWAEMRAEGLLHPAAPCPA